MIGIKFRPAWAGLVEQPISSCFVVEPGGAGGPSVTTYTAVWGGLAILKYYVGCAWRADNGIVSSSGDNRRAWCRSWRINWDNGDALHPAAMYTDWTAVILLLLTAAPLAVVVGTAAFFIWNQKKAQRR